MSTWSKAEIRLDIQQIKKFPKKIHYVPFFSLVGAFFGDGLIWFVSLVIVMDDKKKIPNGLLQRSHIKNCLTIVTKKNSGTLGLVRREQREQEMLFKSRISMVFFFANGGCFGKGFDRKCRNWDINNPTSIHFLLTVQR